MLETRRLALYSVLPQQQPIQKAKEHLSTLIKAIQNRNASGTAKVLLEGTVGIAAVSCLPKSQRNADGNTSSMHEETQKREEK